MSSSRGPWSAIGTHICDADNNLVAVVEDCKDTGLSDARLIAAVPLLLHVNLEVVAKVEGLQWQPTERRLSIDCNPRFIGGIDRPRPR